VKKGFFADLEVAEVVLAEGEAAEAAALFFDVPSFAGEGDALLVRAVVADPTAIFRVWPFAGEGETAPARVVPGVVAALGLRCAAGEGDAVELSAAGTLVRGPSSTVTGDSEGAGV
jgi:hypothetical protein